MPLSHQRCESRLSSRLIDGSDQSTQEGQPGIELTPGADTTVVLRICGSHVGPLRPRAVSSGVPTVPLDDWPRTSKNG